MTTETLEQVIAIGIDAETKAKVEEIQGLASMAGQIQVTTIEENQNAGEFLKSLKGQIDFFEKKRVELKAPIIDSGKKIDAFFKGFTTPLEEMAANVKQSMTKFMLEQKRLQEEAEKKAFEEARKAEQQRIAALQAQAVKAQEAGKTEKAEALLEKAEAVHIPVVIPVIEKPSVKGVSMRTNWKGRIVDINKIPQSMYLNDPKVQEAIQSIINKMAAATKGGLTVPGVEFYEEHSIAAAKG